MYCAINSMETRPICPFRSRLPAHAHVHALPLLLPVQGFACFEYPSDAAVEEGLEYPYGYDYTPLDLEGGVPAAAPDRASS